jgi:DNA-binding FadR family transcriptional regulator
MDQEADSDPRYELKIDPGTPIPEAIADALRGLIDDGEFKPGAKLPNESELARKLKVARSSVRTALQRLEAQDVLQVRRGLGWYVRRSLPAAGEAGYAANLGDYRTSDLFELRIGLEGLAASLAAVRASDAEIENIAKLNTQHEQAVDQEALLRTDVAFHGAIFEASRNALLTETYNRIIGGLADWRYDSYASPGTPRRSARDHGKIVRFLRNHDSGGARVAMDAHLQRLYDQLPEMDDEPLEGPEIVVSLETDWHRRGPQR